MVQCDSIEFELEEHVGAQAVQLYCSGGDVPLPVAEYGILASFGTRPRSKIKKKATKLRRGNVIVGIEPTL